MRLWSTATLITTLWELEQRAQVSSTQAPTLGYNKLILSYGMTLQICNPRIENEQHGSMGCGQYFEGRMAGRASVKALRWKRNLGRAEQVRQRRQEGPIADEIEGCGQGGFVSESERHILKSPVMVNIDCDLTGSHQETNLGCVCEEVSRLGQLRWEGPTLNAGGTILGAAEEGERAEPQLSPPSLLPDWTPGDQVLCSPAPGLPCHDGQFPPASSQNQPFLPSCFFTRIASRQQEKR